jgi:dTDP-glucose pyrophosphorylase
MNIVVPMAGAGSRFARAGYSDPKPLIPLNNIPMIQVVIKNIRPTCPHRFIFICQNQHIHSYELADKLKEWAPGCIVIGIDGVTDGAACTVLKSQRFIDNDTPLMIANSDQYIDININQYFKFITDRNSDGTIMTMKANDPKWSFIDVNEASVITRVVEKEVISNEATVGIYNFATGSDFVSAANEMIEANLRVNNEFYVAPAYNILIRRGLKFNYFNIGSVEKGMYGLGTPSDLSYFLRHPVCKKALDSFS